MPTNLYSTSNSVAPRIDAILSSFVRLIFDCNDMNEYDTYLGLLCNVFFAFSVITHCLFYKTKNQLIHLI